MKIASFFVALLLLVGALSDSVAADAGEDVAEILVLQAPTPQHDSCEQFGSAYTGKSGKVMSMGKSGKGLGTSKSSKANSELGTGTLKVGYGVENETEIWLFINNVHPNHCTGELVNQLNVLFDSNISNEQYNFYLHGDINWVIIFQFSNMDFLILVLLALLRLICKLSATPVSLKKAVFHKNLTRSKMNQSGVE